MRALGSFLALATATAVLTVIIGLVEPSPDEVTDFHNGDPGVGPGIGQIHLEPSPNEGELAPDFELPTLDGKSTVRLSDFQGKAPVALIFGSFS